MNEWIDGWMNRWMDEWMNEWMNGWMDGWMNEWMDEWMNGWIDEWMDGWILGYHILMDVFTRHYIVILIMLLIHSTSTWISNCVIVQI